MGYGDHVPTTTAGKLISIAVFYIGIAAWLQYGQPISEMQGTQGWVASKYRGTVLEHVCLRQVSQGDRRSGRLLVVSVGSFLNLDVRVRVMLNC